VLFVCGIVASIAAASNCVHSSAASHVGSKVHAARNICFATWKKEGQLHRYNTGYAFFFNVMTCFNCRTTKTTKGACDAEGDE